MNLRQVIRRSVEKQPDKTAVIEGEHRISYAQLFTIVQEISADLKSLGIGKGSLVGLQFPNSIAYVAITFAVWEVEAIVVPIGTELKLSEVEDVRNTIQLDTVIRTQGEGRVFQHAVEGVPIQYRVEQYPRLSDSQEMKIDAAFIRFTSGTTGVSKGVVLSHQKICERIEAVNETLKIGPEDTILWLLSMAHHFVSTILLYIARNATVVIVRKMLAGPILEAAARTQATVMYASPFHYSLLAADSSAKGLATLRLALSTTIGLPDDVFHRFYERFQIPVVQAYGIIEIGLVCMNICDPLRKIGSVGRVLQGYEIRLRNKENYPADEGSCGEVWFRGPGFFDAYFHPWADADRILEDGWFDTGDIGRIDADGFVYLVARKKDVINIAGMKVFPQEIEAVINQLPGVKESCVYGMQNARFGELVAADVVREEGALPVSKQKVLQYCRTRLASYKIPEEVKWVEKIQKTPVTSKIIRCPVNL